MTKREIQLIRSLTKREVRNAEGLFVAEGEKLILEIVASKMCVEQIYVTQESALCSLKGIDSSIVEQIAPSEMERISQLKSANSSLALVQIPNYALEHEELRGELIIALDDVQNPGNLGTIIRLADWFGVRHILASRATVDCYNPKVVQATMGALTRVKVHYCDLASELEQLGRAGVPIFGAFLEGENIYGAELPKSAVIVMGNEGQGVGAEVSRSITAKLFVPPYPADNQGSESLNVAIATSIICSEFRRR